MNKKIVFAIPSMAGGGAERVVSTLANNLCEKNDVYIITLTGKESFYVLDEKVTLISKELVLHSNKLIRIFQQVFLLPVSVLYYSKQIKNIKATVVISFIHQINIVMLLVKMINKDIKLIISERNDPFVRKKILQKITMFFYKKSNLLVCQSKAVENYFSKGGVENLAIIPNPLNEKSIGESLDKDERIDRIVSVGRLFPQKNHKLLIKSFSLITKDFPSYCLEIYGDGPLKNQLNEYIKDLNLQSKIFLMKPQSDIFKKIRNSKLFVMSSDYEGFPNVLLEALSSGIPAISTNFATGVANELINKNIGMVVPIKEEIKMAEAMVSILSNEKFLIDSYNYSQDFRKKYNVENISNDWIDIINRVIGDI